MTSRDSSMGSGGYGGGEDASLEAALGRVRNQIGRAVLRRAVDRVGRYRVVAEMGHGGFGVVYLAEQDEPVRRSVAVKLLDPIRATELARRHFELERQVLAQLSHPHIATMIDAGQTEDDQLYLVMELVARRDGERLEPGRTLTQHCDHYKLTIRERLELFVQVCDAVQHAHGRGIIHRDIKPSNILVAEVQSGESQAPKAVPKVIDFGISKLLHPENNPAQTQVTQEGVALGSLSYMSPEQALGRDISIQTDVYSLGAVLYELLTGTSSLPTDGSSVPELLKQIMERDPTPPSRLGMSEGGKAWNEVAQARGTDASTLERTLRRELEWIPLKAMRKDRQYRYGTASDLAADVRRYLAGEALVAGPESKAYRLSKFVQRHRVPVAAAAAVMLALSAGLAVSLWQRSEAMAARNAEKERAEQLKKVSDFQSQMLSQIDTTMAGIDMMKDVRERFVAALEKTGVPEAERTARLEALQQELVRVNATDTAAAMIDRTILRPAIKAIDDQFKDDPRTDASLRQALADLYSTIGLYDAALPLQESALATRRRVLGEKHADTIASIANTATLQHSRGRFKDAEALYREAQKYSIQTNGESSPTTISILTNLGKSLLELGNINEATSILNEAVKTSEILDSICDERLNAMASHGFLFESLGEYNDAEVIYRKVLEARRTAFGYRHRKTLTAINNLGYLLSSMGRHSEAIEYYLEAESGQRYVSGEYHPSTIAAINNVGYGLDVLLRHEEAEARFREALRKAVHVFGVEHIDTLKSINNVGVALQNQGKLDEAEHFYRESLRVTRAVYGNVHLQVAMSLNNMGLLYLAQNRFAEAESAWLESLEVSTSSINKSDPFALSVIDNLAYMYVKTGRYYEAGSLSKEHMANFRNAFNEHNREKLASILKTSSIAAMSLGNDSGRYAVAEADALEAYAIVRDLYGESHRETTGCAQILVNVYDSWNRATPNEDVAAKLALWRSRLN